MPSCKFIVRKAGKLGKGTFALKDIKKDSLIDVVLIRKLHTGNPDKDFRRTRLGRYVNHSTKPNTKIVKKKNRYILMSNRAIDKNEQLFADYRKIPFANMSFKRK